MEGDFANSSFDALIKRWIEPDDFPFSLLTLAGVAFLFVREILGITTVLQRRIINPFGTFKFIFAG